MHPPPAGGGCTAIKSRAAGAESGWVRIVATSRLQPGMKLARPVYSCSSGSRMPLLQPDAIVTERVRTGLARAGVFAVYIDDGLSEGIEPTEAISAELRDRAVRDLSSVFSAVTTDGRSTRVAGEQVERLGGLVQSVLGELRDSGHMVSALMDLQAFDAYTLGHSLNVCVLGLMIGDAMMRRHGWKDGRGVKRFDHLDDRLEKLGVGLLLHDIGKLLVPVHILQKPGKLSDDEMAIVRGHPEAGLDLIEAGAISALSRVVIVGHHERLDGKGYPHGRGADLHPHAQIGGIADVYDAVSSMRVYQARRPTHEAWELVMSLGGSAFPIELVEMFKRTIAPYPEGVAVRLSDERRGIVAHTSREHIARPRVRVTHDPGGAPVTPYEIELNTELDVTIADTLQDLEGPLDPPPAADERQPDEMQEQRMAAVV